MYIYSHISSIYCDEKKCTGKIYFSDDTNFFPKKNWNDFINIILNWWIIEVMKLSKNNITIELLFMDGPYSLIVTRINDILIVKGIERRLERKIIFKSSVSVNVFFNELKRNINKILLFYYQNKITNEEIEDLKGNYSKLIKIDLH